MKSLIVTALFDIKRGDKGDGRTMDQYFPWLKKTLELKCDIVIYTEDRFKQFILDSRVDSESETHIIIQDFKDVPFYKHNNKIKEIISSKGYLSRMADTNRIECFLSEYNVIQYSKFEWLKIASEMYPEYNSYFWMDAGCSRFFDNFDMNLKWPNQKNFNSNKFTVQGNGNFVKWFDKMNIEEYMWDNNCMLVGTLFGGNSDIINKMYNLVNDTFQFFLENNCINNEQFAIAIIAKKNPELFDIKVKLGHGHLPLFKMLGQQ